ncbi:unnamed protein product, partial [Symbiodinium sp. KB8]
MPEYRYTVTVSVDSAALSLDSKSCLCAPLQSVPAGSRLLRLALPGGGSLKPKGSVSSSLPQGLVSATFGVYRTQSEFVSASLELEHPFDAFAYVPDGILRNLGDLLISGPLPIMRKRLALLTKWRSWASDLDRAEAELHKCIDDLSENGVNSSWEVAEKIDLRALDELLWVTSRLMKIMLDKGAQPVIKCVDLE